MASALVLAAFKDYFPYPWLQGGGLVLLVVVLVAWYMYRKKQM